MEKNFVCIVCPVGCTLCVSTEGGGQIKVTGARCKRGVAYGKSEWSNPTRTLTSTVPIESISTVMLPVKSDKPLPKHSLLDCMTALRGVRVRAPIRRGDVIVQDILGLGVNIISSKSVLK